MLSTTPKKTFELLKEKRCHLLDVREPQEYNICHIEGSILLPLSCFDLHKLPQFSHPVIVYCRSGARSAHACLLLQQAFADVQFYNLEGGILAWSEQGFETL
jgi:rhodanese-related sulfurtransferase